MTVQNQDSERKYPGTGSIGPFVVDIDFIDPEHLSVAIASTQGRPRLLTLNSDYTVNVYEDETGGEITLRQPLAQGYTLYINRRLPLTQHTSFEPEGPLDARDLERVADRGIMIAQQQERTLLRALKVPFTNPDITNTDILGLGPLRLIRANRTGTGFEAVTFNDASLDQSVGAINITVLQVNHGLSLGQFLSVSNNAYGLALAATPASAEVIGVVAKINSVDSFVITTTGLVRGAFQNLTPGSFYYLSPVTPGGFQGIDVTTPGQVSKPLMQALNATDAYIVNYRGKINPEEPEGTTSSAITNIYTQTNHGFQVTQAVRFDYPSSHYVLSLADNADDAEVVGIVNEVIDANTFSLVISGYIEGLTLPATGTLFLSDTVPGALTTVAPTTVGHVNKPLIDAISLTSGFVNNWRGAVIPEPSSNSITSNIITTGAEYTPSNGETVVSADTPSGVNVRPLPTTFQKGQTFIVLGYTGTCGWQVTQGSNQFIYQGSVETTTGPSGYVASQTPRDNAIFACVDDQSSIWTVLTGSATLNFI